MAQSASHEFLQRMHYSYLRDGRDEEQLRAVLRETIRHPPRGPSETEPKDHTDGGVERQRGARRVRDVMAKERVAMRACARDRRL
jgi:hypothetical protein